MRFPGKSDGSRGGMVPDRLEEAGGMEKTSCRGFGLSRWRILPGGSFSRAAGRTVAGAVVRAAVPSLALALALVRAAVPSLALALALVPAALPGCGGKEEKEKDRAMESAMKTVSITTADGVVIEGGLAGSGPVGLVLAHGLKYLGGKDSFAREARWFAEKGVAALAISFRGYPAKSIPPMEKGRDKDIAAAVSFMAGQGCRKVFVLGSSMGGWAALEAAPLLVKEPAFAGLVLISAGTPGAADDLACPKLFVAARDDPRVLALVTAMNETAAEPKKMILFDTGGHGQALFESHRGDLLEAILDFVTEFGREGDEEGR